MSRFQAHAARRVLGGLLLASLPCLAEEPIFEPSRAPPLEVPRVEAHVEMQNFFLYRNDSDFDRTPPLYNANGQGVGALATVFRPTVVWRPLDTLRAVYQAEVGLNYWSRQNPDQQNPLAPDVFVLKHRELYVEGELMRNQFGFKVGYQRFIDPTGLFMNHWIGVAQAEYGPNAKVRASVYVGEMPSGSYDGIPVLGNGLGSPNYQFTAGYNNDTFQRDIFVFGGRLSWILSRQLKVVWGLANLYDSHLVGQTRWALTPNVHLELDRGFIASLDALVQLGKLEGVRLGGGDRNLSAWALQGHLAQGLGKLSLHWNVLALSPDGNFDGSPQSHAFLYSGKCRSATVMITEDELRNWYDSLDQRMGAYQSGFFVHRAGLLVADVKASWFWSETFQPALIVGGATVLNPSNALDQLWVGVETDVMVEAHLNDHLIAQVLVGSLVPGGAGAALINKINLARTDPILMAEATLKLAY